MQLHIDCLRGMHESIHFSHDTCKIMAKERFTCDLKEELNIWFIQIIKKKIKFDFRRTEIFFGVDNDFLCPR